MLYLKQILYSFKMQEEKSISEQIDEFNKIIDDIENIKVSLDDEDKVIVLLSSISRFYEHLKNVVICGEIRQLP